MNLRVKDKYNGNILMYVYSASDRKAPIRPSVLRLLMIYGDVSVDPSSGNLLTISLIVIIASASYIPGKTFPPQLFRRKWKTLQEKSNKGAHVKPTSRSPDSGAVKPIYIGGLPARSLYVVRS